MVTNYLIPESNQSGLNGNIDPKSLKGKSMEELLQMKKEKEASIEQDKKLLLKNDASEKAKKRHERFLRFDVEDLTHINAEIDSRKQATPAPAPAKSPVAPPATKPIVPAPVTPATKRNEEEPKTGFFTPTNILLVLLVVGGGFFFLTRKEK